MIANISTFYAVYAVSQFLPPDTQEKEKINTNLSVQLGPKANTKLIFKHLHHPKPSISYTGSLWDEIMTSSFEEVSGKN